MDQSLQDSLRQLKQARLIVLKDPKLFPTIVGAILPNIAPETSVECRRWGGEFLTEAFGTPAVSLDDKEAMSLSVLSHIRAMIESPNQDAEVLKSTVQVAASMYPLVFKWM